VQRLRIRRLAGRAEIVRRCGGMHTAQPYSCDRTKDAS
jgi:hypothetical protein